MENNEEKRVVQPLQCPSYIVDGFASGLPDTKNFLEVCFYRFDFSSLGYYQTGPSSAPARPEATVRIPMKVAYDLAMAILTDVANLSPEKRMEFGLPKTLQVVIDGGTDGKPSA